ncbi:hypothetical protein [Galactobacter caseinivorans]|uniref:DUF4352 domain-containing protein n=1 Tax=Galactobacter caseinivorans TaxID=2676123 RepID=A0A496PHJ6_9MICC|nr:hypothetical protein [Galactobacter caseinivorans]RKW69961.1 hypothetical protein DWQ67_10900 [Galactobacter caseinivorans]
MSRPRPQDRKPEQHEPQASDARAEAPQEGGLDALLGGDAAGEPGRVGGGEAAGRAASGTRKSKGTQTPSGSAQETRPRTPRRVLITAILGAFLGALSLVFAFNLDVNINWIWAAVVGLVLAGAAWVMAALEGSRKRWGMLSALVCVLGIGAPLVVNAVFIQDVTERSQREQSITDQGEDYDESAAAAQLPEQVKNALALGSAQFVAGVRVSLDAVERDASAAVRASDPEAPAPEGRYVTATVSVLNNAEAPVDPATTLGMDLIFADGTVVDSTQCVATLKRPVLDVGALEQGKEATFDVCFDVPASHSSAEKVDAAAVRVSNQIDPTQAAAFWKVK